MEKSPYCPTCSNDIAREIQERNRRKQNCQPLVLNQSQVFRIWSERIIISYEALGAITGPMFRKIVNGRVKRAICGDLDYPFQCFLRFKKKTQG